MTHLSIRCTERLANAIERSVGSVGDSYDEPPTVRLARGERRKP